jgi:predicted dehydrogenase
MSEATIPQPSAASSPGLSHFMDRRNFVRTSVLTGAGVYLATSKGAVAQATSPNKVLKAALVGCGAQGQRLFMAAQDIPDKDKLVQFVAICDIWDYNRRTVGARVKRAYGACNEYVDLAELLEKEKDLDVVFIATPDFLHAPFTRQCLAAGKAVYCEKMMSNTLEAAADMVKSQREYGHILQIGHQRHSNPRYHNLRDNVLHKGLLGRVTHCYAQWNRGISASQPLTSNVKVDPAILSKYGYGNFEEFLNWRYFSKYGGGPIADLGAHQIDLFNWFWKTTPKSVIATGAVDYYDGKDGRPKFELPDNVQAIYEYDSPEGTRRCYYQVLTTTGSQGYYEKLMGVEGSAIISESPSSNQVYKEPNNVQKWDPLTEGANPVLTRSRSAVYNKVWEKPKPWFRPEAWLDVKKDSRESKALESYELGVELTRLPHSPHVENFLRAAQAKDAKMLNCPVDEAYRAAVTVLKCYESMKTGAKYIFQPSDFTVA